MGIVEKLSQYRIAKNTSVLAITQLGSRLATILYVAALARYVGSEGIGKISTASSLNGILLLIAGPGLSVLFVRDVAPNLQRAGSYVANTLLVRLLLFIPFVALTFLAANSGRYPADTIFIIHLYTLVYICDSLTEILICVFRAHERMEYEGGLQIARDVVNISFSLIAIYLHWSLYAIVFMSVVAQVFKLIIALRLVSKRFIASRPTLDVRLSKTLLLTSLPFGILLIIQTLEVELGTFVLSLYYQAEIVGIYAAASSLIMMLLMIPNSFSNAIFPNLSRMFHRSKRELREFYRLSYKYLLVLGFPLGLGTILVGQRAILLIYGNSFSGSAIVVQIMAIFLFTIVGYSNGPILQATGRQNFFAWTEGASALVQGVLCFLLVPPLGPSGAALAFMLSGMMTFFIHSIACHRQLELSFPWGTIARVALATIVMGVAVELGLEVSISWIIVALIVAPPIYGVMLLLLRVVKWDELRTLAGASSSQESVDGALPLAVETLATETPS